MTDTASIKVTADATGYTAELDRAAKSASAFSAAQDAASQRVQVAQAAIAEAAANGSQASARQINAFVTAMGKAAAQAGMTRSEIMQLQAAQLGVASSVQGYAAQLDAAAEHTEGFSLATGGARRELAVLAHEAATGNWTRFAGSLGVLAERTGVINLLFSATGAVLLGAGVAALAFIDAIYKGAESFDALTKSSSATNGYIGLTTGQLKDMAVALAGTSGSITDASAVLTTLISSGRISGDTLLAAGQAAQAFAQQTGMSADKAAEAMVAFATDPAKALTDLQEHYHEFTADQITVIEGYIKEGNQAAALAAGYADIAGHHKEMTSQVLADMGLIVGSYEGWKIKLSEVANWLGNIGKASTQAESYATALAGVAKAQLDYNNAAAIPFGNTASAKAALDTANAQLAVQKKLQDAAVATAAQQKKAASDGDATLRANSFISDTKYSSPSDKHKQDLDANAANFAKDTADLDKNGALYAAALKKNNDNIATINEQYAKKTRVHTNENDISAALAALVASNQDTISVEKSKETALKALRDTGAIDLETYYAQLNKIQDDALKSEIANANARAELASGKKNKAAQETALGDAKKLTDALTANDAQYTANLAAQAKTRSTELQQFSDQQATLLQDQVDKQNQATKTMFMSPEAKANSDAAYALNQTYYKAVAALRKQYDDPSTDQALYAAKLADIKTYHDAELDQLTTSQANQLAIRNSYTDQIKLAMVKLSGDTQTNAELVGAAFTSTFSTLSDALSTFVTTGKFSFSSFAESILDDLAKIALKAAESQIFNSVLGSSSFFSQGGGVGHFASGGNISGAGTGTSDSIPAMLSNGEYVINAASASKYGSLLESINSGKMSHFATGGAVGSVSASPGVSSGNSISLSLGAGNQGLTMDDLQALAPHIQNLVDKRITQRTNGQGGIMYRVRNGMN